MEEYDVQQMIRKLRPDRQLSGDSVNRANRMSDSR